MTNHQKQEQRRLGYGPGSDTWRKKMKKFKAAVVVAIASLFGMACGTAPEAAGHHVDGDCYGFVVFDTPFVTSIGTFAVGPHPWPDGVTSLTGTQNNGTEKSSVSQPDDCGGNETTTTQGATTSTLSTTTTTSATTTTSTTAPGGTTTSTSPPTTSVPPQTTSSAPPATEPPSSSTTSPTRSTVPQPPSGPSTSTAPILPATR